MAERVEDGRVVRAHYLLEANGAVVESTFGGAPVSFLQGGRDMLPGIQRAVAGREVGEKVTVELPPEDAFGVRKGSGPVAVHRREFPKDLSLQRGMPLTVPDSAGNKVQVWVTKVLGSKVWIDVDHPLAGQPVTVTVEVLAVREALAEEVEHGHAHGSGTHGH